VRKFRKVLAVLLLVSPLLLGGCYYDPSTGTIVTGPNDGIWVVLICAATHACV